MTPPDLCLLRQWLRATAEYAVASAEQQYADQVLNVLLGRREMIGEFILQYDGDLVRIGFENAAGRITWISAVHIDQASDLFGHETYLALYRDRQTLRVSFTAEEM